ncbi:hypothetical protein [Actinacidiphila oryziradicis]|uniref:Uncharacterized protein n=1 Tax=Actinacidiphila oryziradicis TaxID=2571141 RepID=A0A4U0SHG6_9ACTN|nr:hypothetical protein [Actinacidiphila oryziradicis]TJZ99694.1 hypothetical protein FCI23_44715 [Actinacidiphila oryziradicis]
MPDPQTGAGFDAPTPDMAYASAPNIIREIGWVARTAANRPYDKPSLREFWLRKAALLDRIAIKDGGDGALTVGEHAAAVFAGYDRDHHTGTGPHGPDAIEWDPSYRPYVRQEYAAWLCVSGK